MVKDSLIKLVNDILEIHENIEKSWLDYLNKESIKTINFNSVKVYEISQDNETLAYIRRYINFINKQAALITPCFDYSILDRTRVKDPLSVKQKLESYCNKKEKGRIKTHKCLNDLFGFRVVVDDPIDCEILTKELQEIFPSEIIITNSSKLDGYKAVHVYTPAANGHFKWELQIWDRESYDLNISLHESHKRKYITDLKEAARAEKGEIRNVHP